MLSCTSGGAVGGGGGTSIICTDLAKRQVCIYLDFLSVVFGEVDDADLLALGDGLPQDLDQLLVPHVHDDQTLVLVFQGLHCLSNSKETLEQYLTLEQGTFFTTFPIRALNTDVVCQIARLGFVIFSYHLIPRYKDSNQRHSVELHQTGTFEGRSTD